MSAVTGQQADHGARILAELEAVAAEPGGGRPRDDRHSARRNVRHVPDHEHSTEPRDAADVQAMDTDERRAWFAATTARRRWKVVGRSDQPEPAPHPRYAEDAACRGSDVDLTELVVQGDAEEHVHDLCAACPVIQWCAADARDHDAHGLWAGVVLRNGRPASEVRPSAWDPLVEPRAWLADQLAQGPRRRFELLRDALPLGIGGTRLDNAADALGIERAGKKPWTLPPEAEQPMEPDEPLRQRPGQRTQPRRLTRAARRRKARR